MTQPPSPSAAALEKDSVMLWQLMQTKAWHSADAPEQIEIIDAALRKFAAQAVKAEQGKQHERGPNEKGRTFYEDPAVCDPPKTLVSVCPHPAKCEEVAWAAERAKPAASDTDMRALVMGNLNRMRMTGESYEMCARWIAEDLAAALAERGRVERERAAKLMETFPDRILHFWDRPGGPPGNGYAPTANADRAAAIRNQTTNDEA